MGQFKHVILVIDTNLKWLWEEPELRWVASACTIFFDIVTKKLEEYWLKYQALLDEHLWELCMTKAKMKSVTKSYGDKITYSDIWTKKPYDGEKLFQRMISIQH